MRLGRKRMVGGEPRQGRVVNSVQGQVVPRGTIRSIMATHRREGNFRDGLPDDVARAEVDHRDRAGRDSTGPDLPDAWSVERGRRQLTDLIARARREG